MKTLFAEFDTPDQAFSASNDIKKSGIFVTHISITDSREKEINTDTPPIQAAIGNFHSQLPSYSQYNNGATAGAPVGEIMPNQNSFFETSPTILNLRIDEKKIHEILPILKNNGMSSHHWAQ